jgi:hypothetical protein
MTLVEHARRELERIGEEPETIDWYCRVIAEFASFGHSGGSASVTIPVLHELLQFRPLSPLTDDAAEWIDQTEACGGTPTWQSRRDSTAFSADGGRTYWLLAEREAAGSDEVTPLHHSKPSHTWRSLSHLPEKG